MSFDESGETQITQPYFAFDHRGLEVDTSEIELSVTPHVESTGSAGSGEVYAVGRRRGSRHQTISIQDCGYSDHRQDRHRRRSRRSGDDDDDPFTISLSRERI